MTDNYYLLVPTEGLLEVLAGSPINVEATLTARGGEGRFVSVVVEQNHQHRCRVSWYHSSTATVNPRAREALVDLADLHMIFTGPVLFHEVHEERIGETLQMLSMRDG